MADKPIAEKRADHERHEDAEREQLPRPPAAPEVVEVDTLVEREDLGPGAATLVAAGDPVPADLADRPRRPASDPAPGPNDPEPIRKR
jgi:hypothetical protein